MKRDVRYRWINNRNLSTPKIKESRKTMPAKTLEEIYAFFHNKAVNLSDFDQLYVPADKARSKTPAYNRIKRRLLSDPTGGLKMLFAGHRGCGKTTELVRLQREIQEDFVILNFSAVTELDILNISYIELFIATMSRLFRFMEEVPEIKIDEKYLENIKNWLSSREIEEINET